MVSQASAPEAHRSGEGGALDWRPLAGSRLRFRAA